MLSRLFIVEGIQRLSERLSFVPRSLLGQVKGSDSSAQEEREMHVLKTLYTFPISEARETRGGQTLPHAPPQPAFPLG